MVRHRRRRGTVGPTDLMDADISFPLNRLFDRFNLDHIPERKRMDEFEHRDLAHIKHYKAAVKIFGGPLSRKRVMVAPPMETPLKHRLGLYMDKTEPPAPPVLNSDLNPQKPYEVPEAEELVLARQAREREDNYKSWFQQRQKFRNDLENMGLNSEWLSKKPNKTVLEERVLKQITDAKNKQADVKIETEPPPPVQREKSFDSTTSSLPQLKVPAPLGLQILDKHLKEQKLRLIDLFTSVDKDKDWKISREDFIKSCEERNIPISRALLEDMLITLDMNLDEYLDYKEMAQGMEVARRERREDRRKQLSRENTNLTHKSDSQESGTGASDQAGSPVSSAGKKSLRAPGKAKTIDTSTSSRSWRTADKQENQSMHSSSKFTSKSNGSHDTARSIPAPGLGPTQERSGSRSSKTGSPQWLEPPPIDTTPDRLVLNTEEQMVDLRKRDREGLKGYNAKLSGVPPTITTGNKAIDDHSMQCTLEGEVGEMVDRYRQKQLQEFFAVQRLCQEKGLVLSEKLLEKVLLYPPEKPHSEMTKVRAPDSAPLVSSHFADKPKPPRPTVEQIHKNKVRRSKSGKLLIDHKHLYPEARKVSDVGYKQALSTGRAVIRRKTDCWMTFEEYVLISKKLAARYEHLHGRDNSNAFWPGHMLDKIRLCMPPYDGPRGRNKEASVFSRPHRTPAVNYGYEPADVWQTNSDGYTQIGIHDPYKNKTIY